MNNLKHLSDQELIDIYNGVNSMKEKAMNELNNRGVFCNNDGSFTQRTVKTGKQIEMFLRLAGFDYLASLSKNTMYASGCCEYVKPMDALFSYQINGDGLSEIKSVKDTVIFSENGADPSVTPMYRYSKIYPNFREMIIGEKHRGIFNEALINYSI